MARLAVVDDDLFLQHEAPSNHPEREERLLAARRGLGQSTLGKQALRLSPRAATPQEICRVHKADYEVFLRETAGATGYFDEDTYYCAATHRAALCAAGGALSLVESLSAGESDYGFGLLRPPGHHARPEQAMGFCIINNVAVAAARARSLGLGRVAIIDWDVHHGNGTQEMFFADPNVLFVSLHQSNIYPGTGLTQETGEGKGQGYTLNLPLKSDAEDAVYHHLFRRIVIPVIKQFSPDLVLVSAGYDAHRRDPLASMSLSEAAYGDMTQQLCAALPNSGRGRLAMLLEGGYDLLGIERSVSATLNGLVEDAPHPDAELSSKREAELNHLITVHGQHWQLR